MKKHLLTSGFLIFTLFANAQNAEEILKQSYQKCQSIKTGTYEMDKYMKFMDDKDTSMSSFTCSFKKLLDDTLYSSAFFYKKTYNDTINDLVLYTGNELVFAYSHDSVAQVTSVEKWSKEIKSWSHNQTFYFPFTSKDSYPIPIGTSLNDDEMTFEYLGTSKIGASTCHLIRANRILDEEDDGVMKTLKNEYHYWINKEDQLPVQYTIAYDMVMDGDTMFQYEKFRLNKYTINSLKDESVLTMKSIPTGFKLKDYEPYVAPELLKIDSFAPNWELMSLDDEMVNLGGLKGELVLIDFFYKACYPCMLAIPALQSLHEKYKEKGLRVIGIDPIDGQEKVDLAAFLAKRNVSYTVLLDDQNVVKDYHVSGYPTMYLIDRTGKIIYTQVGYGEEVEAELDEVIKQNL